MRITDGNIFEAMRLILPEHRELMRHSDRERKKRKQPILSEDERTEMGYILEEALEHKRKIRVIVFDPFEDVVWEGCPMMKNGKLHLETDEEVHQVPLESVVRIEFTF